MSHARILVEGSGDSRVLEALMRARGLAVEADTFAWHTGLSELLKRIPVAVKESEAAAVGVVVDANGNFASRWRQVTDRFARAGHGGWPARPPAAGALIESDGLRLGIWLMPDNTATGKLEDFLAGLIPPTDRMLPLVDGFLASIFNPPFEEKDRPKARIHSWLGVQQDPGASLQLAVTKKYFDSNHPTSVAFADWVRWLVG